MKARGSLASDTAFVQSLCISTDFTSLPLMCSGDATKSEELKPSARHWKWELLDNRENLDVQLEYACEYAWNWIH